MSTPTAAIAAMPVDPSVTAELPPDAPAPERVGDGTRLGVDDAALTYLFGWVHGRAKGNFG